MDNNTAKKSRHHSQPVFLDKKPSYSISPFHPEDDSRKIDGAGYTALCTISPDGSRIYAALYRHIGVWNLKTGKIMNWMNNGGKCHDSFIVDIRISSTCGEWLVTMNDHHRDVFVWNTTTLNVAHTFNGGFTDFDIRGDYLVLCRNEVIENRHSIVLTRTNGECVDLAPYIHPTSIESVRFASRNMDPTVVVVLTFSHIGYCITTVDVLRQTTLRTWNYSSLCGGIIRMEISNYNDDGIIILGMVGETDEGNNITILNLQNGAEIHKIKTPELLNFGTFGHFIAWSYRRPNDEKDDLELVVTVVSLLDFSNVNKNLEMITNTSDLGTACLAGFWSGDIIAVGNTDWTIEVWIASEERLD
jgi:hypothetical protein